jgi:hypothetical protein
MNPASRVSERQCALSFGHSVGSLRATKGTSSTSATDQRTNDTASGGAPLLIARATTGGLLQITMLIAARA